MRGGRRVQSRGFHAVKHEIFKMADEGEEIREVDRVFCGSL